MQQLGGVDHDRRDALAGERRHGGVAGVVGAPHAREHERAARVGQATASRRLPAMQGPPAARRSASGCPEISAMNGSGKFPNDFTTGVYDAGVMGVKVAVVGGGSTYTPELVEGFVTRGDRLPVDELILLDIDAERLGDRRRARRAHDAPGRLGRHAAAHRRQARGARGRRLRDRAAAGRRQQGAVHGRDDPAGVRLHRAGDDRRRAGSRRRCGRCRSCSIWPSSRRRSARPARGSSTSRTRRASSRRRCSTTATTRWACATWRSGSSGPSPGTSASSPIGCSWSTSASTT